MPGAGGNGPDITIKMILDTKGLTQGSGKLDSELKKLKAKFTLSLGKQSKQAIADLVKSLKGLSEAFKSSSGVVVKEEKKKQDAFEATNKKIEDQKKKLSVLGKLAQGGSKFGKALAAGAGVGGLTRAVTPEQIGSFIGRMISRSISGVANFAITGATQAYQTYMQYGAAQGQLVGLGTRAQLRGGAREAGKARGARLGFSMIDTAQQAAGIGRATGNIGAVYRAQQAARATGMDVGEIGGYMGMVRQAGYGFGGMAMGPGGQMQQVGQSGPKQLEKIIAAGMLSGIEKSRLPEFMQGMSGIVGAAGARAAGAVDTSSIAAFASLLGKSGQPGFQGARGMNVAQQLMQATVTPGGGEAGQAMMLQALGFGKPGGETPYYEALRRQQQGMQRPENVAAMFKEVYSQLGVVGAGGRGPGQQEANIALNELTGLSLEQVETAGDILNSGKSAEEQMAAIKKLMEEAEPIEKQSLKAMKEFGGIASYIAGKTDQLIGIGSKWAPIFQEIDKVQRDVLLKLSQLLPGIIEWLKKIYVQIQAGLEMLKPNEKQFEEFLKRQRETMGQLEKRYKTGTFIESQGVAKQAYVQAQSTKARSYAFAAEKIVEGLAGPTGVTSVVELVSGRFLENQIERAKQAVGIARAAVGGGAEAGVAAAVGIPAYREMTQAQQKWSRESGIPYDPAEIAAKAVATTFKTGTSEQKARVAAEQVVNAFGPWLSKLVVNTEKKPPAGASKNPIGVK